MRISWKLGRVAGIDLFLHPSALLLFFIAQGAMPTPLGSFAFVLALLASVTLHELGHALMARRYGIGTEDITLYVIGGVARLQRMPRSAGPELLIALAGPAVNVALVPALAVLSVLGHSIGLPTLLLQHVMVLNGALALFNLLPIFPMDGGRVLRALLSGWLVRPRATSIAAMIGQGAAVIGGIAALAAGNWQLALLAMFVFFAAGMERVQVMLEGRLRTTPEGFVDVPPPPAGFRWTDRGDGVWRLAPIMMAPSGPGRSWT